MSQGDRRASAASDLLDEARRGHGRVRERPLRDLHDHGVGGSHVPGDHARVEVLEPGEGTPLEEGHREVQPGEGERVADHQRATLHEVVAGDVAPLQRSPLVRARLERLRARHRLDRVVGGEGGRGSRLEVVALGHQVEVAVALRLAGHDLHRVDDGRVEPLERGQQPQAGAVRRPVRVAAPVDLLAGSVLLAQDLQRVDVVRLVLGGEQVLLPPLVLPEAATLRHLSPAAGRPGSWTCRGPRSTRRRGPSRRSPSRAGRGCRGSPRTRPRCRSRGRSPCR